jgi:hypothetical protein
MKKCILGFIFIFVFIFALSPSVSADSLFIEGGAGYAKSWEEAVLGLRFQHDTSLIFDQPSFYEAVYLWWSNENRAQGLGFARSIVWEATERNSFSFSFGLMVVNHKTEHLGTNLQFYSRLSYSLRPDGHRIGLDITHISNGKALFGWDGPNSGENFLTLSVQLF